MKLTGLTVCEAQSTLPNCHANFLHLHDFSIYIFNLHDHSCDSHNPTIPQHDAQIYSYDALFPGIIPRLQIHINENKIHASHAYV
jgi:hypothetical protein